MAIIAGGIAKWVMLSIFFSIYFDLTEQTSVNSTLHATLWALGLMNVFIAVALTPAGEAFFRFLQGCRRPIRAEEEKLLSVFHNVCKSVNVNPDNYEFYISDDKLPNAFTMGRKTVCVTRSLLNGSTEEELQGVLAHKLGHHINGDAVRGIIFNMITLVGQIIMWGGFLIGKILSLIKAVAGQGDKQVAEHAGIFNVFAGMVRVLVWFFQIFVWIPIFVGACFGSRQQEYRADEYAAKIGYSEGLLSFLNRILDIDGRPSGFMGLLYRTHSKTGDRIRKLEDL